MIYIWTRNKKYIIAALVVVLLICGIIYKNTVFDSQILLLDQETQSQQEEVKPEVKKEPADITVYVCGNVKNPANVTLPEGSRVEDAIKLAGGLTEAADINGINLAQKLTDEDMVYVPQKGEILESTGKSSPAVSQVKKSKLNINKATAEELDALPGIGPSTAQKIIDYRNTRGSFKTIEELNNVSGIGTEKYKKLKDLIMVD